jgi:hypothetical protein
MPLTLASGWFIAVIRRTDSSRRRRALMLLQGLALALERLSVVLRFTRDSRAEGWLIAGAARFFRLHSKPDEA